MVKRWQGRDKGALQAALSDAHWSSLVEKAEGTAWFLAGKAVGCTERGVPNRGTTLLRLLYIMVQA